MTFYQKLEMLCKNRGTTITSLAAELGFSRSAGTTWKKSKRLPRNSTLKKIADYFEISIEDLEAGITVPADYASIDTSSFRQDVYAHLLEKHGGNETAAIKAYLAFEQAEAEDACKDRIEHTRNAKTPDQTDRVSFVDNTIRLAGRDGTYVERRLTDEQMRAFKLMLQQMPDADDL